MSRAKGCWTCKERKILCDRGYPECSKCKKSNLKCQGYVTRLSWPKARSARAVVGRSNALVPRSSDKRTRFINATFWDLEMYHHLSSLSGIHERSNYLNYAPLSKEPSWNPFLIDAKQETLIEYFNSVASKTLATFDHDFEGLRGLILRLAFSDDAPASKAVVQSLLAVSAIQRHGSSPQADRLKLAAIRALKKSFEHGVDGKAGIQHVAAQMLLCSFEVMGAEAQWPWYLCAANRLVSATNLASSSIGRELQGILDWMTYHHVMCRFSLQYWRKGSDYWKLPVRRRLGMPIVCEDSDLRWMPGSSWQILLLLSQVVESIQAPSNSGYHGETYAKSLPWLENKLESLQPLYNAGTDASDASANLVELYRLASLIYLERAYTGSSGPSEKVDIWLEKAHFILKEQKICQHPFLLLILGIESRDDEQRRLFLNLLGQADTNPGVVGIENVHRMLQSVWLQDDLETERILDYRVKLRAIFSSSEILPSIA